MSTIPLLQQQAHKELIRLKLDIQSESCFDVETKSYKLIPPDYKFDFDQQDDIPEDYIKRWISYNNSWDETITKDSVKVTGVFYQNGYLITTYDKKTLNPQNIQKILLGLALKGTSYISVTFNPKTQVKTLSDKWFSLREENDQAVSSLWDSGEEGQIQVLEEFLGVLKGIK